MGFFYQDKKNAFQVWQPEKVILSKSSFSFPSTLTCYYIMKRMFKIISSI